MTQKQTLSKFKIVQEYNSLDAKPLDFSFKNIFTLEDLKFTEPRQGVRKEIQQEIQIVENNQTLKIVKDEENNNAQEHQSENENNESQNDQKNEFKSKDTDNSKKDIEVIRAIPFNVVTNVIATNNVQLNTNMTKNMGGATQEENNIYNQKKVVKVNLICSTLILSYNKISSLLNFSSIIESVMFDPHHLAWIDLSHNNLESLQYDFSDYPNLKILYLHCNYLSKLQDIQQLSQLNIRQCTIHGNPIETIPNFRLYMIAALPNLKKLDTVLVSKKERDNSHVWIHYFMNTKFPEAKNPQLPPVQQINEKDIKKEKQIK